MCWAKCNNTLHLSIKRSDYLSKLISILIKFRKEEVTVMGDTNEMYHQIIVSPKDLVALHFVWRKFSADPI